MSIAAVGDFVPAPKRNMAVRQINDALQLLDMDEVWTLLRQNGGRDPDPIEVCAASLDDWNCYVHSDSQLLRPHFMDWHDNKIWIVEVTSTLHAETVMAVVEGMLRATGTLGDHLKASADSHNDQPSPGERKLSRIAPSVLIAILEPFYHANWRSSIEIILADDVAVQGGNNQDNDQDDDQGPGNAQACGQNAAHQVTGRRRPLRKTPPHAVFDHDTRKIASSTQSFRSTSAPTQAHPTSDFEIL
ncbi:unnamed protein product [Phytophthora lilii]|uniref:Unnamed protein product n=1 Tax=Phytophthora lilii TaxID=2077276 RepID=A0A9W6U8D5_9STRA|nr:unnamed protein product [Phytophthora lilii]